jgi:hypothetical protein
MKLSDIEFRAMQSLWRKLGQTYFELPLFKRMGLDVYEQENPPELDMERGAI